VVNKPGLVQDLLSYFGEPVVSIADLVGDAKLLPERARESAQLRVRKILQIAEQEVAKAEQAVEEAALALEKSREKVSLRSEEKYEDAVQELELARSASQSDDYSRLLQGHSRASEAAKLAAEAQKEGMREKQVFEDIYRRKIRAAFLLDEGPGAFFFAVFFTGGLGGLIGGVILLTSLGFWNGFLIGALALLIYAFSYAYRVAMNKQYTDKR